MNENMRFVEDDEGHWYLIPEELYIDFYAWIEAGPYWEDWEGIDYNNFSSLSPSNYVINIIREE